MYLPEFSSSKILQADQGPMARSANTVLCAVALFFEMLTGISNPNY